jgi:hypothetical protein
VSNRGCPDRSDSMGQHEGKHKSHAAAIGELDKDVREEPLSQEAFHV